MTDIVERLRKASIYEEYKAILSNLGDEAADLIELMRATAVPRDEYELLRDEVNRLLAEVKQLRDKM
jgi:cell division protein FtsB